MIMLKKNGWVQSLLGPLICSAVILFMLSCQQAPTKAMTETVNPMKADVVLLDTRTAFDFESFHVSGSMNIWWEDFLVRRESNQRASKKIYKLDDLEKVIERLASQRVGPYKTIILIGRTKDSAENLKWQWLLKNLELRDIKLLSLEQAKEQFPGRRSRSDSLDSWKLTKSEVLQKELILEAADKCFLNFSSKDCT